MSLKIQVIAIIGYKGMFMILSVQTTDNDKVQCNPCWHLVPRNQLLQVLTNRLAAVSHFV